MQRRRLCLVLLLVAARCLAQREVSERDSTSSIGRRRRCSPQQVHLALTGDATEMRVMWTTEDSGCTDDVTYERAGRHARQGAADGQRGYAAASRDSYTSDDMCGKPASEYDFDPPQLHSSVLTGLEPGDRYTYRIGDHGAEFAFRAANAPGPDAGFVFVAYGDMGESADRRAKSPGAADTVAALTAEVRDGPADLVLHVGDISYANGDPVVWDTFMDAVQPFAAAAPYMVAIGNHEYDYRTGDERRHHHHARRDASGAAQPYDPDWGNFGNDSGGECGVPVVKRFVMPGVSGDGSARNRGRGAPAGNSPFWYSFEDGPVHFTFLSTEHDLARGSPQREWLEADLAIVARCTTPWLVVAMHRPMYVVFPHKSNRIVGAHLRDELEATFDAAGVDLVLSGHVHAYARTCNVFDGECEDSAGGGMIHATLGCAGHKLSEVEQEQPEWLEAAAREFGFARVTVHDGSAMTFEFVRTSDGEVHDAVRLTNTRAQRRHCLRAGVAMAANASAVAPSTDVRPAAQPLAEL